MEYADRFRGRQCLCWSVHERLNYVFGVLTRICVCLLAFILSVDMIWTDCVYNDKSEKKETQSRRATDWVHLWFSVSGGGLKWTSSVRVLWVANNYCAIKNENCSFFVLLSGQRSVVSPERENRIAHTPSPSLMSAISFHCFPVLSQSTGAIGWCLMAWHTKWCSHQFSLCLTLM